jgi:hypothetical protein
LERGVAIALLKEIFAERAMIPIWVDLVRKESELYELRIKPLCVDSDSLKRILDKYNFACKEVNGRLVIYSAKKNQR